MSKCHPCHPPVPTWPPDPRAGRGPADPGKGMVGKVLTGNGITAHSDGERDVICPHHSALFRLPEGVCHEGPCRDDRLTPVPLAVEAGVVRIAPAR